MADLGKHVLRMIIPLLMVSRTVNAEERSVGRTSADLGCLASIDAAHLPAKMPIQLVRAISTVEAGRRDATTRRVSPWPWTINVAGSGYFYQSKAQAIAAVLVLQAIGLRSIDVGCMQINLMYHPRAFASLDDAFDPSTNVAYAASFLSSLFNQTGSWPSAAAAYHSQTAEIGAAYERQVMALYPMKRAEAAKQVEVVAAADTLSPTPEMLRLNQESQQDQDRLRLLFGPVRPGSTSLPKQPMSGRLKRSVRVSKPTLTVMQRTLLQLANRSWLNGASIN